MPIKTLAKYLLTAGIMLGLCACSVTKNEHKLYADIAAKRISLSGTWVIDNKLYLKYGKHYLSGTIQNYLPTLVSVDKTVNKIPKNSDSPEILHGIWYKAVHKAAESITPKKPKEAVIVEIQNFEVVLYRTDDLIIKACAITSLPAGTGITEKIPPAKIHELIYGNFTQELKAIPTKNTQFLLPVEEGDLTPFIFADTKNKISSPVELPLYYEYKNESTPLSFSIDFIYHYIIKSHVFTLIKAPFSSVYKMTGRIRNGITTVFFSPSLADYDSPIPSLNSKSEYADTDDFNKWLDENVNKETYKASVKYLIDGEKFFTDFIIETKKSLDSVYMQLYLFKNDPYGTQIADMLKEQSKFSDIRVLIDDMGIILDQRRRQDYITSKNFVIRKNIANYLEKDSSVKARTHPNLWVTFDHTKLIIVDKKKAYVGGMNVGYDYRYVWHDMMVALEGPIVDKLLNDFYKSWAYAGFFGDFAVLYQKLKNKKHRENNGAKQGMIDVRILKTDLGKQEIYNAQLEAVKRANRRIYIQNAYFANDAIVNQLVQARRRGVDVRVILPGDNDIALMDKNNAVMTNHLIKHGIKVYIYPGMTHIKAAIYDNWACLGSANFDRVSFFVNSELDIAISDINTVEALNNGLFQKDFAVSRLVTEPIETEWSDYLLKSVARHF